MQPLRGLVVAVALDRDRELGAELLGRAEQARAGELHDRPQVGQPVLDRRAGQRDPGLGGQGAHRLGLAGGRVLDVLRLVADHPGPPNLAELLLVPGGQRVGGDHQVRGVQRRRAPRRVAGPRRDARAPSGPGVNRSASRCQFPTSDIGHTSSVGRGYRHPLLAREQGQRLERFYPIPCRLRGRRLGRDRRGRTARPGRVLGRGGVRRGTRPGWGPVRGAGRPGRRAGHRASRRRPRADDRQVVVGAAQAASRASAAVMVPVRLALEELQRGLQVPVVEFHPLAAQPDQGNLEPGQLLAVPPDPASRRRSPGRSGSRPGPQPELRLGGRPPLPGVLLARAVILSPAAPCATQSGSSTPNPAPDSSGPVCLRNLNAPSVSRVTPSGAGLRSALVKLGEQPSRGAKPGQQVLLRVPDPGGRPAARRGARPDVRRGQQQAGVVGRLQRELDRPRRRPPPVALWFREPARFPARSGGSRCGPGRPVAAPRRASGPGAGARAPPPRPRPPASPPEPGRRRRPAQRPSARPPAPGPAAPRRGREQRQKLGSRPSRARTAASASASRASVRIRAEGSRARMRRGTAEASPRPDPGHAARPRPPVPDAIGPHNCRLRWRP